jgi:hypothetical protein
MATLSEQDVKGQERAERMKGTGRPRPGAGSTPGQAWLAQYRGLLIFSGVVVFLGACVIYLAARQDAGSANLTLDTREVRLCARAISDLAQGARSDPPVLDEALAPNVVGRSRELITRSAVGLARSGHYAIIDAARVGRYVRVHIRFTPPGDQPKVTGFYLIEQDGRMLITGIAP